MNPRVRGLIVFAVIVFVAVVFCAYIPFVFMPSNGFGIALPIITVPGEVVAEGGFFGINLTNTIIGTLLADVMVLIFVGLAWRASKGWTNEIPGRFQSLAEAFISAIYGFLKGIGGDRLRTAPMLWPIAGTLFIFLLAGNFLKLFPGVETVGKMHCSHIGFNGYGAIQGWTDSSYRLWVDTPLDSGTAQTEETEHACYEFFNYKEFSRFDGAESVEGINAKLEEANVEKVNAETAVASLTAALSAEPTEEQLAELAHAQEELGKAERAVERQTIRLESASELATLATEKETLKEEITALEGDSAHATEDTHSEEASADHSATTTDEHGAEVATETDSAGKLDDLKAQLDSVTVAYNTALTQIQYPGATLTLNETQLNTGVMPYLFHITPFVRGPATDLSLTFALAIMAVVLVQVYGVWALGPAYFEKFINISALGNLGKKPLGAIDFIVGLIEIISEIGKIVSLAFRLFGNLFAGGVALMAISFLVSIMVPGIIYGLEIIIGMVQALVFSVLFVVFSVQAMEAHGDHEHDHAEGHESH